MLEFCLFFVRPKRHLLLTLHKPLPTAYLYYITIYTHISFVNKCVYKHNKIEDNVKNTHTVNIYCYDNRLVGNAFQVIYQYAMYVCMYVCQYVCMYVCMYVYMYVRMYQFPLVLCPSPPLLVAAGMHGILVAGFQNV